jgi:hypothetical protein
MLTTPISQKLSPFLLSIENCHYKTNLLSLRLLSFSLIIDNKVSFFIALPITSIIEITKQIVYMLNHLYTKVFIGILISLLGCRSNLSMAQRLTHPITIDTVYVHLPNTSFEGFWGMDNQQLYFSTNHTAPYRSLTNLENIYQLP